jgi:hypothetical protein
LDICFLKGKNVRDLKKERKGKKGRRKKEKKEMRKEKRRERKEKRRERKEKQQAELWTKSCTLAKLLSSVLFSF